MPNQLMQLLHNQYIKVKEGANMLHTEQCNHKQKQTNELDCIPITVHRKTWSSNMDDNTKVEDHDNFKNWKIWSSNMDYNIKI